MTVKLAILKSGETVISDIKELVSDEKVCGYLFERPHKISTQIPILLTEESDSLNNQIQVSLSPWILLTNDQQIPVAPDWIVTMVDPIKNIKEMYEEKINGKNGEVSFTEE